MSSDHWQEVQDLFHATVDLPPAEREARLAAADPAVAAEARRMIEADHQGDSLLDSGVAATADRLLGTTAAPARLGPYRILRVLGEGGMGVVYLGVRDDLGSQAAIKVLRDAWLSPARRERFTSEQRTLAQLDHPAIARLFDADALPDGTPWFVMELVEGQPITTWCRERSASITERLRLFRAVAEGIDYAHRQAVIHRDLKPSNILVKPDGTVKLLDFGIAKHLETLDSPVDQTQTGLRLMTPAYASPEQIRGARIGVQTDVYSLGVVLYELVVGRLPFDLTGLTPSEVVDLVATREPEKPSTLARAVSERTGANPWVAGVRAETWADLDVLCQTAMHRDPARRYQSVEALIRDLDHLLGGEPLEARADTLRYRVGKFVRRNRGPAAAVSGTIAAIVLMVLFYTVRLRTARNEAVAEAARTQQVQRLLINLFQGGDDAVSPPDSLRAVTLLDDGVREAASLDHEPAIQAELYQTLGGVYQKLGKLDRADTLLRLAVDLRRRIADGEAELGRSLVALGELRIDQVRLDTALILIKDGLARIEARLPASHPTVRDARAALGRALEEKGDYDQSIAVLGSVVRQDSIAADTRELALHLSELANAHFYAGHYPAADAINHRLIEMNRARYGERHPLVAEDLINLGASQIEQGHYPAGERYYRQALGITEGWYGPNHPRTAMGLSLVGRAVEYGGRHLEADSLMLAALAIQERIYGPNHLRVANTLNSLASSATLQDRLDDAEGYSTRALGIYQAIYGADHQFVAVAMGNLASIYQARKDYPRAEPMFRQSLAIYLKTLSPTHVNVGIGHIRLGRILLKMGRYDEATRESRAGYDILIKQTDANTSFLKAARKDLVAAFDSLKRPAEGARFRAELADTVKR